MEKSTLCLLLGALTCAPGFAGLSHFELAGLADVGWGLSCGIATGCSRLFYGAGNNCRIRALDTKNPGNPGFLFAEKPRL